MPLKYGRMANTMSSPNLSLCYLFKAVDNDLVLIIIWLALRLVMGLCYSCWRARVFHLGVMAHVKNYRDVGFARYIMALSNCRVGFPSGTSLNYRSLIA